MLLVSSCVKLRTEMSHDLTKIIIEPHATGEDCKTISKQRDVPPTTAAQMIQRVLRSARGKHEKPQDCRGVLEQNPFGFSH